MSEFLSLDELGIKYNTDKASKYCNNQVIIPGHDYLNKYEIFLKELRNEEFTLVELGCYTGASLKMWKEYFQNAFIVGVDINPKCKNVEQDRIHFICSDSVANNLPLKLRNYSNIKCIIDDCSHSWSSQRMSFEMLFPLLKKGGYYIIEDLELGSMGAFPEYPPKILDSQVFWDYAMDRMKILRVSENRNQTNYRPFFFQLPKYIQNIELSIGMAVIIPGSIIFRKK